MPVHKSKDRQSQVSKSEEVTFKIKNYDTVNGQSARLGRFDLTSSLRPLDIDQFDGLMKIVRNQSLVYLPLLIP